MKIIDPVKAIVIGIFFCLTLQLSYAQERLGLPAILNYSKDDYKASTMNWDILKGEKGEIYFANNYGLVQYDGLNWELVLDPKNRTYVTSLGMDLEGRIYLGASDEMGYVLTNAIGQKKYQSLNQLIPEKHLGYGMVWKILSLGAKVYFFTNHKVFIYYKDTVEVIPLGKKITFAQKLNNSLYLQQEGTGLSIVKDQDISPIVGTEALSKAEVKHLYAFDENFIIVTADQGLFEWRNRQLLKGNHNINQIIGGKRINVGRQISDGKLVLGTFKDGIYIFSPEGDHVLHLSKANGLQDNTVQAIYEDELQNIWVALGNGISYIELGSDFYHIDSRSGVEGSVYSAQVFNNSLFLATNQGVYFSPLKGDSLHQKFSFVPNTEAHAWNLSVIDQELLLANHQGAYLIDEEGISPINEGQIGAWQFIQPPGRGDLLFQGSYEGIFLYQKENGNWKLQKKLEGYEETAREMVFDQEGILWVGHGYLGVFRIKLDPDFNQIEQLELFDDKRGLPENLWNNLFKIHGKVLIGTQKGIYQYNEKTKQMQPHPHFQKLLGDSQLIRRLIPTPEGNLFFIKGLDNRDEIGIIKGEFGHQMQTMPFQKLRGELIPAFESLTFYEDQLLFGSKEGLIIYKPNASRSSLNFHTQINKVFCSNANDSIIFGQTQRFSLTSFPKGFVQQLPFELNALKITYAASFFEKSGNLLYRSYLEGFDREWTSWSPATSRSFTNLKEGNYTFHVESRNIYGVLGAKDTFTFIIKPPWYRTMYMYVVYGLMGLLFIVAVWWVRRRQIKQLERKREKELRLQRREYIQKNLEAERKMTLLQMEKLKSEVNYKSKELATSAIHLAQLNDTVLQVIDRIAAIKTIKDPQAIKQLKGVVSSLNEMIVEESNWDQFELHFNEIHDNFIKRLKEAFPNLTPRDIRLCAYLRLNLASKEIAPLMGISYRGIEALRYRIRKKLKLEAKDNLMAFILGF
ncbi:hypothetical protein E1171_19975 [Cytophagales bacterium RKSG123]|nr:triple tyrosine motif-containing protein [Xanthovirga aplysinae]MTI33107.1 hypothetical protein [Xanthovirga aplysinae]